MITESAGTLRYSAASKTEFRADGVRPSRNRGFRCRNMVGTPLAAPESERSRRVPGTLGLNGVDLVVSEAGNESKDCFFTRALRRRPRFRIVIGSSQHSQTMAGWGGMMGRSLRCRRRAWCVPCLRRKGGLSQMRFGHKDYAFSRL